ncbi:classical arabinogalactan protein 9 isoform X4 [Brassica rapa]|uniref:classical arabinogalactan protein 9 isoform X4 n=1 Tax=Brassica campestris TaxID=3711 RepID=UPI0004F1B709|nr:classical arabinogalactan protein 9 isoform X4 [Brassica rapa]
MALLVISSFQSQLRPPARLRTPSPSSVSTPPSVSFVSTPPSDSESRLHPPTPLIRLRNPSLPSRLRPASHLSRPCPASPPSKLQVHPPPDPPPCTYPPVLPEARSPPKPPDPPDVPFNLVLLLMSDTASSQLVSKTPDLKSLMLNLVPVFSDGVISLVCVDDTSFVSKCLSPAVCSVFLYWCVDWSLHRFSPRDFIYPPLPFIMLVIVVVDSTMGCSIPIPNSISVSLPLPLIQGMYC